MDLRRQVGDGGADVLRHPVELDRRLGRSVGHVVALAVEPGEVLVADGFLQLKLIFYFLAGINLFAFYRTGMSRVVGDLGAGEDAPLLAKTLAGASLFFWIAVMYFGRLIPFGQLHL